MLVTSTPTKEGFETIFLNSSFKCAFITASEQYAYGKVRQLKRHNDSDEVFVLLTGSAVLLTRDETSNNYQITNLAPKTAYNVLKSTWHYLAVSSDAVLFVAESGSMLIENTQSINIETENISLLPQTC